MSAAQVTGAGVTLAPDRRTTSSSSQRRLLDLAYTIVTAGSDCLLSRASLGSQKRSTPCTTAFRVFIT